jgi:hypothetical protein
MRLPFLSVALVGYQHHSDPAHSIPFYGCLASDILNVCVLLHLVLPMSRPITIPMLDSFVYFVLYHTGDFFAGAFFQDKKWHTGSIHIIVQISSGGILDRALARSRAFENTACEWLATKVLKSKGRTPKSYQGLLYNHN